MRALLTALGVVSALIIIGFVAELSFLFWYGRGGTPQEKLAYGVIAGVFELVKAVSPFWIYVHWRSRRVVAAALGALLWCVAVGLSFTSAAGLAAHNRLHQSINAANVEAQIAIAERDIKGHETRLALLDASRSVQELEGSLEAALRTPIRIGNRTLTVDAASESCTKPDRTTATACVRIGNLRTELARAQERDRLEAAIGILRTTISKLQAGSMGEGAGPDLQARFFRDAINRLGLITVTEGGVQTTLVFLIASALELGAGWVLYLAIGTHVLLGQGHLRDHAVGDVEEFGVERIMPKPGSLPEQELLAAYVEWCRYRGKRPLSRRKFNRAFQQIARRHKIEYAGGAYQGIGIDAQAAMADAKVPEARDQGMQGDLVA